VCLPSLSRPNAGPNLLQVAIRPPTGATEFFAGTPGPGCPAK